MLRRENATGGTGRNQSIDMSRGYDILGHLAYISLVLGTYLLATGNPWGWPFRLAGSLGWAFIGWRCNMSSVYTWSTVFSIVDGIGWYNS